MNANAKCSRALVEIIYSEWAGEAESREQIEKCMTCRCEIRSGLSDGPSVGIFERIKSKEGVLWITCVRYQIFMTFVSMVQGITKEDRQGCMNNDNRGPQACQ